MSTPEDHEDSLDFSPPAVLSIPLWRSLLLNFRERLSPETLPPLELTSRPVDVGMLLGDAIEVPWYRTIFTSIGDVVAPETLPPLQLESRPAEVEELLGDRLQHGWWSSLLRNLADKVAPENPPPLNLTAKPETPATASTLLDVPRWSALMDWPQGLPAASAGLSQDAPARVVRILMASPGPLAVESVPMPDPEAAQELAFKLKRSLRWSRWREALWIFTAAAEVAFLLVWLFVKM
jgi:hypothetical protein